MGNSNYLGLFILFSVLTAASPFSAGQSKCSEVFEQNIEAHFPHVKLESIDQIKRVMEGVFNPSPGQKAALEAAFDVHGKLKPEIWNRYFNVYSQITWASSGYRDIIQLASKSLPTEGFILDIGSGTGNFIVGLHSQANGRKFIAIDNSDRGLEITRNKAIENSIEVSLHKGNILSTPLTELIPVGQKVDAALMNNVLYTLKGRKAKLTVLKAIFDSLPPRALFFLNDPNMSVATENGMRDFVTKVGLDMTNPSKSITEYDLALFAEVNRRFLATAVQQSKVPVRELAEAAGFEVISSGSTYYGHCDYLVLRRP